MTIRRLPSAEKACKIDDMTPFRIEKRIGVPRPAEHIWSVLSDLPGWNRWNPVDTNVSGTVAFGGTLTLTETIPGLPSRQVTGKIGDWQPNAQLAWTEKRGLLFTVVRYYEIDQLEPGSCIVSNGFIFSGLRGELYHDKHKRLIRPAVEQVSEALKAAAEA